MQARLLFFLVGLLLAGRPAAATTYYVSIRGSDAQAGTTLATAWRSVQRVNATTLQPGDQVLFAGGQTFVGGLVLGAATRGTAAQPISFGSYGEGWATISSGGDYGLRARNAAGIALGRLYFAGSGRLNSQSGGVLFEVDSAAAHLSSLTLDSLDVSGYRDAGVAIRSQRAGSGYADVRVTNSRIHDNGEAGLSAYSAAAATHRRWYVGGCRFYNNTGRLDVRDARTGYGLLLADVDSAVVAQCVAYNNGYLNAYPAAGPAGLGAWRCARLTVQACEVSFNRTRTVGGGGIALEGGCTGAVVQYNYAHDNDGAGYLVAQPDTLLTPTADVRIRYNISENDARRADQAALTVLAPATAAALRQVSLHNNTVLLTPPANGTHPQAACLRGTAAAALTLRNNVLQTTNGLPLLCADLTAGVRLEGNCYWSAGADFVLRWGTTTYAALPAWRQATSQEQLGRRPCGLNADPQLTAVRTAAASREGYRPAPSSALIGAGLNLLNEFGEDFGPQDYFGLATPAAGRTGNIGAAENQLAVTLAAAPAAAPAAWCSAYPTRTRDQVHVLLSSAPAAAVALQLYDLQGRRCANLTTRRQETLLPVAGLAAGLYVLRVEQGSHRYQQRIVVEE